MHDDLVDLAQFPEVAAALFGPGYIEEHYERGSWRHRYYTAFSLLSDRHESVWRTLIQAYFMPKLWPSAPKPSADRLRHMRKTLRDIMVEVGIELYPLD